MRVFYLRVLSVFPSTRTFQIRVANRTSVVSDVRKGHNTKVVSSGLCCRLRITNPPLPIERSGNQYIVQTSVYPVHLLLYPFINRYSPTCPLGIPRFSNLSFGYPSRMSHFQVSQDLDEVWESRRSYAPTICIQHLF
jgi:hypothetical protein